MKAALRDLAILFAASLLVRVVYASFFPDEVSADLARNWMNVAAVLEHHQNPYQLTDHLNWPPFWMQCIYALLTVTKLTGLRFYTVVRALLVGTELAIIAVLHRWLTMLVNARAAFWATLLGICLNPICVLLVIQHGNFDVFVGLWVLLSVIALCAFQTSRDEVDWLRACLFLGLGILTKTVPLVLTPLLFAGAKEVRGKTKLFGAVLALAPVAFGMSIIYVLAPDDVTAKVLGYRSASGWFGFSGIFEAQGWHEATAWATRAFGVLEAGLLCFTGWRLYQERAVTPWKLVLLAGLLLLMVPALGPGYAPQYAYWWLPLLAASAALGDRPWRMALVAFFAVAVPTYLFEYWVLPSHGHALSRYIPTSEFANFAGTWMGQSHQTLARLPIFAAYLGLLAFGARTVARR